MPHDYLIPKDVEFGGKAPPPLTYKKFVEGLKMGMLPEEAAKYTGSKDPNRFIQRAMQNEWVQEEVHQIRLKMEEEQGISRQKVTNIVTEAIDMAKLQGVPSDMIRGAAELNKMYGYYEPEKKQIDITSHSIHAEISVMDEEMLLELAGQERDAIEAEFEELDEIHAESGG